MTGEVIKIYISGYDIEVKQERHKFYSKKSWAEIEML